MQSSIRKPTWVQSLKISAYSLKFKALSYIEQYSPNSVLGKNQQLFLLGEKFTTDSKNVPKMNQLIFKKFCNIFWATYRVGFPALKDKSGNSYITDAGWGCMIRAGQMYIAETLKRHLKKQNKQQMIDILKLFDDFDQQSMFCIQNITRIAKQQYNLQPGQWYNPSQIAFIINQLYSNHPENAYKQSLKLQVMNNSALFFDQLIMKMTNRTSLCSCKKKVIICHQCYKKSNSLSIMILTRIGLGGPEKKYLACLDKMIESPYFTGLIGGKPDKALFIVGKIQNKYIYLDPHLTQSAVSARFVFLPELQIVQKYFDRSVIGDIILFLKIIGLGLFLLFYEFAKIIKSLKFFSVYEPLNTLIHGWQKKSYQNPVNRIIMIILNCNNEEDFIQPLKLQELDTFFNNRYKNQVLRNMQKLCIKPYLIFVINLEFYCFQKTRVFSYIEMYNFIQKSLFQMLSSYY